MILTLVLNTLAVSAAASIEAKKSFIMAQRRINTYNVRNPVRESDIYDEVDLPEYNINKKQSEAEPQSPPHLQPSVQQSVPKMKHQNKFSRETKTLFSVAALSFFLLLFIAIILASVLISLLKDTQGKLF